MPPIVLKIKGSRPFLPFAELDSEEDLSKTWRVCTKVKDSLENGSRLENLSWRLWHLHQLVASGKRKPDNDEDDNAANGGKMRRMSTSDNASLLDIKSMHSSTAVTATAASNRQNGPSNLQSSSPSSSTVSSTSSPSPSSISASASSSSVNIMTESKRQAFRTLSKNATRILDGDENADQREFEMRVRQFSPSSTGRSPSASKSPQTAAATPTPLPLPLASSNQRSINTTTTATTTTTTTTKVNKQPQVVNVASTNSGVVNQVNPTGISSMPTTHTANNALWLQQAYAMQTNPMAANPTTTTASNATLTNPNINTRSSNNNNSNTSISIPTHTLPQMNQGRAITTTTNTMLPAPSAVYPPYHAYTAGNDLSQLMGAAASMFPQLMGIPGLPHNTGMINHAANSLTGTAAGVLLDDMFGSFPASAYVGDVNRPPTIEIPLEQVLSANGIDASTAAAAAAAAASSNWSTASTPSGAHEQMNTNYFDAWLNVASGRWPTNPSTAQSATTSPRSGMPVSKMDAITAQSSAATSPNPVYNNGNNNNNNNNNNNSNNNSNNNGGYMIPTGSIGATMATSGNNTAASLSGYTTPTATRTSEDMTAALKVAQQLLTEQLELANTRSMMATSAALAATSTTMSSTNINDAPVAAPSSVTAMPSATAVASLNATPSTTPDANKLIFPTLQSTNDTLNSSSVNAATATATATTSISGSMPSSASNSPNVLQPINNLSKLATQSSTMAEPVQLFCHNCGVTSTPLWRRSASDEVLCNACGLYMKLHNIARPKNRKTPRKELRAGVEPPCEPTTTTINTNTNTAKSSMVCTNCYTTNTPLWRRDEQGNILCNACGLYLKLHQERRPLSLKTDVIKKRQRYDASKKAKKAKTGDHDNATSDGSPDNQPTTSKAAANKAKDKGSIETSPCQSPASTKPTTATTTTTTTTTTTADAAAANLNNLTSLYQLSTQPLSASSSAASSASAAATSLLSMPIKQESMMMDIDHSGTSTTTTTGNGNTTIANGFSGIHMQTAAAAIQSANLLAAANGWPTATATSMLPTSGTSSAGCSTSSKPGHPNIS